MSRSAASHHLSYDAAGNISAWKSNTNYDQTFDYDALNRLIEAYGTYGTLRYSYDGVGNRTQLFHQIDSQWASSTDYVYALDSNRLLQAGDDNYSYDAAGSPNQIGNRTLTYNEDNRLAAIQEVGNTVASYDYNALGQRDIKHTPDRNIYFVYDLDGRLIGEYDEQGNAIREYIYLKGEPLAMLRPYDGHVDIFYVQTDHRGAAQSLFAHEGNVGSGVRYMPFGRVYAQWQRFESDPNDNNTQPDGNPPDLRLRYPGQYDDAESELYYNYFRYYDPDTGRYMTSDPIGLDGGLNRYVYVDNNPLIWTDPRGLAKFCCRPLDIPVIGPTFGFTHCYLVSDDGTKFGLYPQNGVGIPTRPGGPNYDKDAGGRCFDCPPKDCEQKDCLIEAKKHYPIGDYSTFGPNSNTFAGALARSCCKGGIPNGARAMGPDGIDHVPPGPFIE